MKSFKVSNDVQFAEKLDAIVGLYLNPPEHAIVLCADEKSQIQALDRTQPGLPIKKGRCGTMTHDYKRNGTATLFAALEALDGTVISMCDDRHRHQEWLKFLRVIDQVTPPEKELHLIVATTMLRTSIRRCSDGSLVIPVPDPLHAHHRFVAEHSGALLPGSHAESATARRLS